MGKVRLALLLTLVVRAASARRSGQDSMGPNENNQSPALDIGADAMVKDAEYVKLKKQEQTLYADINVVSNPSNGRGALYWLRNDDFKPIDRCCCIQKVATEEILECQTLHAFKDDAPYSGFKLKQHWYHFGKWVCPGKVGMDKGSEMRHARTRAHRSLCRAHDATQVEAQSAYDSKVGKFKEDLSKIHEKIDETIASWGCQLQKGNHVINQRSTPECRRYQSCGHIVSCDSDVCYHCTLNDKLFVGSYNHGYLPTAATKKASAIEQCRAGCAPPEKMVPT